MKKISIIIPVYNEEEALPHLIKRLIPIIDDIIDYEFEILFVDDGSIDKTNKLIKGYRQKENSIICKNSYRDI